MDAKAAYRKLSEDQIKEIKEAFELFDLDGSGLINPQELYLTLCTFGYENAKDEIKKIIEEIGNIKDRYIDFTEFLKITNSILLNRDSASDMKKAFARFDDDSTNEITFRNLKRISLELGEQLTDEELAEMVKAADFDGDGVVNFEDFKKLMEKNDMF